MLTDRIAVRPLRFNPRTPSGLYIPEQAQPRINQGIVKYIGSEVTEVKIGQWVIFSAYSGTHLMVEHEDLIILEEQFISAILDVPSITIPGLYYKDGDGNMHKDPELEVVIELIALAIQPLLPGLITNERIPARAGSDDSN